MAVNVSASVPTTKKGGTIRPLPLPPARNYPIPNGWVVVEKAYQ